MSIGLLSVSLSAFGYQPKPLAEYRHGWQGAGNYISAKDLESVEAQIRSNAPKDPDFSPAYQKALCSIELAKWSYREVDTKGITEYLTSSAIRLSEQAHQEIIPSQSSTLPGTARQYHAAWARLEELKQRPGSQCAIQELSCADVALLGLEYETKEGYGKFKQHGIHFRDEADKLLNQAEINTEKCAAEQGRKTPSTVRTSSLDTDALFGFDSASITAAGHDRIDFFVSQLPIFKGGIGQINIVGHTDRIGADAYNQRLSEQRAQAVKAVLIQKVPELKSVVSATGVGNAEPLVTCPGSKVTKTLKSCLQPNRRVTVTVVGN